jgi:uncharacterized membrane protein YcaP (DUF421 family)
MEFTQLLRPEYTLELVLRGTIMYLAIYTLLRVVSRRELGETGATNILLIVLIADASQNALGGEYTSISDGLVLVGTIVAWSVALDAASYRWPWFARLIKPPSVILVDRGRIRYRSLRRELMTEEELWAQLREHGVDRLEDVQAVRMETDGRVSVITRSPTGTS